MDEGFLLFLPTRTVLFFFMTDENEAKECLWEGRGRNPTGSGGSVGRKQVSVFSCTYERVKEAVIIQGFLFFFCFFILFWECFTCPLWRSVFASVADGSAWLRRKRKWSLEGNELENGEDGNKLEIRWDFSDRKKV